MKKRVHGTAAVLSTAVNVWPSVICFFFLFLIQETHLDETNFLFSLFASPKNIARTQNFFYRRVTWTKMMFFLQPLLIVGIMMTYKRLNTDLFIPTVMQLLYSSDYFKCNSGGRIQYLKKYIKMRFLNNT